MAINRSKISQQIIKAPSKRKKSNKLIKSLALKTNRRRKSRRR